MTPERIMPTLTMSINLIAAVVYATKGDLESFDRYLESLPTYWQQEVLPL